MKHTFKQTIVFAAAMLSLAGVSFGQEIIRKFQYQKSDFALIREKLTTKKWIVYNDLSYYSCFELTHIAAEVESLVIFQQPAWMQVPDYQV